MMTTMCGKRHATTTDLFVSGYLSRSSFSLHHSLSLPLFSFTTDSIEMFKDASDVSPTRPRVDPSIKAKKEVPNGDRAEQSTNRNDSPTENFSSALLPTSVAPTLLIASAAATALHRPVLVPIVIECTSLELIPYVSVCISLSFLLLHFFTSAFDHDQCTLPFCEPDICGMCVWSHIYRHPCCCCYCFLDCACSLSCFVVCCGVSCLLSSPCFPPLSRTDILTIFLSSLLVLWQPQNSLKIVYVLLYVFVWSLYAIFIKKSQTEDGEYPFSALMMALNIEFTKLVFCILYWYVREEGGDFSQRTTDILNKLPAAKYVFLLLCMCVALFPPLFLFLFLLKRRKKTSAHTLSLFSPLSSFPLLSAFPNSPRWQVGTAIIYATANILAYMNLQLLDPPTYRVLINTRIIFSGVLLFAIFNKSLSSLQWFALVLLMIGCTTEQLGSFNLENGYFPLILMTCQAFCSSLGGVYFQWILQKSPGEIKNVGFLEKNIFLYLLMVMVNIVFLIVRDPSAFEPSRYFTHFSPSALPILITGSCGGRFRVRVSFFVFLRAWVCVCSGGEY